MPDDKDESPKPKKKETTRVCPTCGKDHRPDGDPLTADEQASAHKD